MKVTIEISPGELVDRTTILRLKSAHIEDPQKREIVCSALTRHEFLVALLPSSEELERLTDLLFTINARLWEIENSLRGCERGLDFGPAFIELARAVYRTNDERFRVKQQIDLLLESALLEIKSYEGQ